MKACAQRVQQRRAIAAVDRHSLALMAAGRVGGKRSKLE